MSEKEKSFFTTDISNLHVDKKASRKTKTIFALSLISLWVPFITAVIALAMIPNANKEIDESQGTLHGKKLLKWAKAISWATICLNAIGLILLIVIYFTAKDIIIQTCEINEYYCQFTPYLV